MPNFLEKMKAKAKQTVNVGMRKLLDAQKVLENPSMVNNNPSVLQEARDVLQNSISGRVNQPQNKGGCGCATTGGKRKRRRSKSGKRKSKSGGKHRKSVKKLSKQVKRRSKRRSRS